MARSSKKGLIGRYRPASAAGTVLVWRVLQTLEDDYPEVLDGLQLDCEAVASALPDRDRPFPPAIQDAITTFFESDYPRLDGSVMRDVVEKTIRLHLEPAIDPGRPPFIHPIILHNDRLLGSPPVTWTDFWVDPTLETKTEAWKRIRRLIARRHPWWYGNDPIIPVNQLDSRWTWAMPAIPSGTAEGHSRPRFLDPGRIDATAPYDTRLGELRAQFVAAWDASCAALQRQGRMSAVLPLRQSLQLAVDHLVLKIPAQDLADEYYWDVETVRDAIRRVRQALGITSRRGRPPGYRLPTYRKP